MYYQMPFTNSQPHPAMICNKSTSTVSTNFKRQPSSHFPSLDSSTRPLADKTNLTQISNVVNKLKRKMDKIEHDSFEYDVPASNYPSLRKQLLTQSTLVKRTKQEKVLTQREKTLVEDRSLRLVTSTIQGMKHWTSKRLPFPVLFEVFGKLDSQLTALSATNTRQFSLIDENDRIDCLFAEVDQSFSNIDRDVQLRIVCRLQIDSNIARCVAIRMATKDEWNERRAAIKQCDFQFNEDDLHSKKLRKNNKKPQK